MGVTTLFHQLRRASAQALRGKGGPTVTAEDFATRMVKTGRTGRTGRTRRTVLRVLLVLLVLVVLQ